MAGAIADEENTNERGVGQDTEEVKQVLGKPSILRTDPDLQLLYSSLIKNSSVSFLENLSEDLAKEVCRYLGYQSLAKGQVLYRQGSEGIAVYMVLFGALTCHVSKSGPVGGGSHDDEGGSSAAEELGRIERKRAARRRRSVADEEEVLTADDFDNQEEKLVAYLTSKGVDLTAWGRGAAKPVSALLQEMQGGFTALQDGVEAVRVVNVARVRVRRPSDDKTLLETLQQLRDGRLRPKGTLLAGKLYTAECVASEEPEADQTRMSETMQAGVMRVVRKELAGVIQAEDELTVARSTYEVELDVQPSGSFPQLRTAYRLHTVDVSVSGLPPNGFDTVERKGNNITGVHFWEWCSPGRARALVVGGRAGSSSVDHPEQQLGPETGRYAAGDGFGETALVAANATRAQSVVAREESVVCALPKHHYDQLLRAQGERQVRRVMRFLGALPAFAAVPASRLLALTDCMRARKLRFGHTLFAARARADSVYVVMEGEMKLCVDAESAVEQARAGRGTLDAAETERLQRRRLGRASEDARFAGPRRARARRLGNRSTVKYQQAIVSLLGPGSVCGEEAVVPVDDALGPSAAALQTQKQQPATPATTLALPSAVAAGAASGGPTGGAVYLTQAVATSDVLLLELKRAQFDRYARSYALPVLRKQLADRQLRLRDVLAALQKASASNSTPSPLAPVPPPPASSSLLQPGGDRSSHSPRGGGAVGGRLPLAPLRMGQARAGRRAAPSSHNLSIASFSSTSSHAPSALPPLLARSDGWGGGGGRSGTSELRPPVAPSSSSSPPSSPLRPRPEETLHTRVAPTAKWSRSGHGWLGGRGAMARRRGAAQPPHSMFRSGSGAASRRMLNPWHAGRTFNYGDEAWARVVAAPPPAMQRNRR